MARSEEPKSKLQELSNALVEKAREDYEGKYELEAIVVLQTGEEMTCTAVTPLSEGRMRRILEVVRRLDVGYQRRRERRLRVALNWSLLLAAVVNLGLYLFGSHNWINLISGGVACGFLIHRVFLTRPMK